MENFRPFLNIASVLRIAIFVLIVSCQQKTVTDCNYITEYHPHSIKAEIAYYSGNYDEAFNHYQAAFNNCEPLSIGTHNDIYKYSEICAKLGKNDLALDFVEKSFSNGYKLTSFTSDSIFREALDSERGSNIISSYDSIRKNYMNSLNLELRKELQQMIKIDQQLRGAKRDSVFKIHDLRLVEIFEEFGYPNEQVVGSWGLDKTRADPGILLLHTDDSIRENYFIPKMKEFVRNGTCSPGILGSLYDNLALYNELPQTHGTYKKEDGDYSDMISDISQVNKNRNEIGLPKLNMTRKKDSILNIYYGL